MYSYQTIQDIFNKPIELSGNYLNIVDGQYEERKKQKQTGKVFSDKWDWYGKSEEKENAWNFQKKWYLKLYGFNDEEQLKNYLRGCDKIFDAGCGLGNKSAWFAKLAPHAMVLAMDYSDAAIDASKIYEEIPNLFFMRGDIADTKFKSDCFDYVNCDQVIMHTENPELTFKELTRISKKDNGEIGCYFYRKKAVPRELLDDYFRSACLKMTSEELWVMSEQLAELGRNLANLNISFVSPEIPALGIKAGEYDIQRFIYWNFVKCFWSSELGIDTSIATNFDWYSPSNARRFSKEEVESIIYENVMAVKYWHEEEACYSGRFTHKK